MNAIIRQKFDELVRSGVPLRESKHWGDTADKRGHFAHFDLTSGGKASMFSHDDAGAFIVKGAIQRKYAELGYERGFLGYPVADERSGHPEEAEPLLALQTGEDNLDNSALNLDYGNRKTALGECRFALKRYAEAEPLLLDGYADLEKRLGPQKPITVQAHQRLHDLYTAWNKPVEAARFEPGESAQVVPTP